MKVKLEILEKLDIELENSLGFTICVVLTQLVGNSATIPHPMSQKTP